MFKVNDYIFPFSKVFVNQVVLWYWNILSIFSKLAGQNLLQFLTTQRKPVFWPQRPLLRKLAAFMILAATVDFLLALPSLQSASDCFAKTWIPMKALKVWPVMSFLAKTSWAIIPRLSTAAVRYWRSLPE